MTDYYDQHYAQQHYSTYDHPYDHHQHGQEYSGHTLSYAGDPVDENVARRSGGPGSHHSHSQSHGSVSASTRSWVQSNMVNAPLPPPTDTTGSLAGQTPFFGSRPLPDPQSYQQQHHHIIRRPLQYDDAVEEEDEEEDYYVGQGHGPLGEIPEMDPYAGYQHQPMPPMRYIVAGPSSVTSGPSTPGLGHQLPRRNRSFVGGFFNGLKRIPKMFRGGEKHRIQRRATFGTEGSSTTATGFTPGNTLPRYLSNPSIGPSNPQFAHRLSQAVANGTIPPDVTPSAFQLRQPLVSPQQPIVMVTAPSEGAAGEEQQAEYFDGPFMEEHPHYTPPEPMAAPQQQQHHQHQVQRQSHHPSQHHSQSQHQSQYQPQHQSSHQLQNHSQQPMERTTFMVYNRDSEAPTITQSHPTTTSVVVKPPPPPPVPPPPIPVAVTPPPAPAGPRVSYPAQLPTRATIQAQSEIYTNPTQPGPSTAVTPVNSPPRRRLTNHSLFSSRRTTGPRGVLSPTATTGTSVYTATTRTSYYDPSFSSELGPVEKFFKRFYHLPWVSQGRVTIDYRPADSPRAKGKIKSTKKPMSSWYHAVMSRSRRNTLDLLSSPRSEQDSNLLSSIGSPTSGRSGRSSSTTNHRHKSSKSKHHRSKRRRTATSGSTGLTQRSTSPVLPGVYPYNVPPYPPYTYPYAPYPMPLPPGAGMPAPSSSHLPRGPRASRSHRRRTGESSGSGGGGHGNPKYPQGGYAPFQPLAMHPPLPPPPPGMQLAPGMPGMYYVSGSPPQSHNGGEANGPRQQHQYASGSAPMGFSPVLVHYVPAYARQENSAQSPGSDPTTTMVSPPTTPQRHTAASVHRS